ncbi:hypothetical protein [Raoultibacter timonensis]|uniref:hypothetical protein n=1 Tax=Raoultibacter timonensis TaxID=1907662 RepID=UPI0015E1AD1E|nr:hypothetical protein [Raoultibacter timonensis]
MPFFGAFMVCGCLCVCTQLVSEFFSDVEGPTLFLLVQTVAALLVPTGVVSALTEFGQAGFVVTVFAAGSTICQDVGIVLGGGSVEPLVTILAVFAVVAVVGIITGAVYAVIHREPKGN